MSEFGKIAILGGTGKLGSGLALRLALADCDVVIGSRDKQRASDKAAELNVLAGSDNISGATYEGAAEEGVVIILSVPFASQIETLMVAKPHLAGKILVDATVPLVPPKVGTVQLPEEGSAAVRAQNFLGDNVAVVSAFQNVGAHHLHDFDHKIECEVLVCGNDKDARKKVVDLAALCGLKAHSAGVLANSAAAEALTSILITINRATKSDRAGIRITGV